jgi:hypothetical protein
MLYKTEAEEIPDIFPNEEVERVKWFTVDEIKKLIKDHSDQVTDGLVDVISRYY